MVVTKTRKKVTKVTKHKVTNNKTKKRHKNKQRGGAPKQRPQSAPASGRRNISQSPLNNTLLTSKEYGDMPNGRRDSRKLTGQVNIPPLNIPPLNSRTNNQLFAATPRQLTARPSSPFRGVKSPRIPMPNQKTSGKLPVNEETQPRMQINVPEFKDVYFNAITGVNSQLFKKPIQSKPTILDIPGIIKTIFNPSSKKGQAGGNNYNVDINELTSSGLKSIHFDEPNPAQHNDRIKYDVVIVGCTPEALYMSILLKLLMPGLTIVVLECGKKSSAGSSENDGSAAGSSENDGPDASSIQDQPARNENNARDLKNETMMSLKYIWTNDKKDNNIENTLNRIVPNSSSEGNNLLTTNIYYDGGKLQRWMFNILPSCFYTQHDFNEHHANIFPTNVDQTAKIQINILEFFLTRRAMELEIVILHNVIIDELPDYVGANTRAIFNATGFFDMKEPTKYNGEQKIYYCNYGIYKPRDKNTFNKEGSRVFKLINKYGFYIATSSKELYPHLNLLVNKEEEEEGKSNKEPGLQLNPEEGKSDKLFKQCNYPNETDNTSPLKWHDPNNLNVPIISIGQSLRGKIIFEWHYLGFADCFVYGLLFKSIYDATAPVVPPVAALTPVAEPPPVVQVPPTPPPVAVSLDASLPPPPPTAALTPPPPPPPPPTAALTPPPPPPAQMQNNKSDIENVTRVNEDTIKQQSKVESDNIVNTALSNISNMFEDARNANARKEALEQETARQKAVSEEAARLKAVSEEAARLKAVEEAARLKAVEEAARLAAVAEANEAARQKAIAEAQEAARVQAVAEAEEAARVQAIADVEEAARVQAAKEAEEAARLKAVAEAEEAARVQAIAEAEEAARLKAVAEAEEVARLKAVAEAEEVARLKAVAEAEEAARVKAEAEETARLKAAKEANEAARLKAVADAEEAARLKAQAEAQEAARLKAAKEANEAARLKAIAEAARLKEEAEKAARLKEEAARETTNDINLEIRDPPPREKVNATPIKTLEIMLGTNAPTEDGDTLDISIEDGENEGEREKDAVTLDDVQVDLDTTRSPTQEELAKYHHELDLSGLHGDGGETRQGQTVVTDADPTTREKVNATPIKTLEIALGTNAPTQDGETLDISIEDVAGDTQVMNEEIVKALKPVTPQKRTLEIALGTDAPTQDGETLDISIEDVADENDEKEDEKNNEEIVNAPNPVIPQKRTLEIVLGTDAPTQDGETLDITIEDANEDEDMYQGPSSNYLRSIVDGAGRMVSPAIDFVSNAVSGVSSAAGRGIVAAAKGAADTAANCTSDRAADATRNALEYQAPTKDPEELRKEQDMDAKLDELKHQITDKVADAGELFVDNAKKMANSVASSSYNPFNKNLAPNIPQNLLMSQNLNPPVKYLNISINPGIEFNPKMLNKNTSSADVHFNPLIKYSDRIINDIPTGKPNTGIYEKFFNNNSFNIMLANTLRGLFGQTLKTIDEATDAGIVDDNIVSTLNTLFATGNVIYINNSPYTIYTYSWNGEWYIDSKIPRNLDYITGLSSSSYRDPEQMQKYRDRQNAAIQKELKEKGIGEKYRMSSIRRERLIEDAKQRVALEKERDAKTTAKKVEYDAATKKKTDKQTKRDNRNKELNLRKNALTVASVFVPELKKEVMKAALNAIMSHKQFIRATMDERDIEIDPLSMSLFFPTDDLLDGMLEKTTLSQDYAVITEMHKGLIKIIEEYDAAEMEMYDTKTKIDDMYGKLKLKGNNKRKEEIINGLLKGKNLPYAIATDNLVESTFAHVDKLLDALSKNNLPVTQAAMQSGGLNLFKSRSNKVSPDTGKIKTRDEVIDSVNVDLNQTISKKDAGPLIEIVKYLGKQIVTTFYNDISELLTTVTQFKDTLANMIELTTTQYASQLKYYEQYITFLSKVENVSKKEKGNELFLMFIAHDKRTYREFNEILDPQLFRMDDMQIPETIDATNYFKDNSLMDIDSAHFNTYIAQILEKRYDASNKLWEISFKRALDAHTTINTYIKEFNDAYERDKQFLTKDDGNSQESSYAEYKQQRDALQAAQDAPNSSNPQFMSAFSNALFQDNNPNFKEIYDMYDSREGKAVRFKTMFINVALAEITTLRKITFLTQSIHADDIVIYKCTLNDFLFKQHAANCGQNPAVKPAFFNEPCDQDNLNGLLKENDDAKNVAVQQKQDLTGELTLLSDNQNNMFAELFPIDDNAKLEKMCNQALTGVSTLFEVTPFNTFMNKNGWSNDCAMQEINAPVVKAFKLSMLNEMFTHASKPISKKVSPSVYKNTNYWDLFCPAPADQSGVFKLLDAVSMLLNAEMHLTSSTIEHKYAPGGTFDLKTVDRIRDLLNAQQNEDNQLAILYQIFKIKFTIIEITSEQSLDIRLSIAGCTNKLAARSQSDGQDAAYIPEEDVKQIEQEEKRTTFAFIIKYQGNYYIPYNSKIGTLLCSTKHLKSVGLDILLWSKCWNASGPKKREGIPPSWINMYKAVDKSPKQQGGADPEGPQQNASTGENNNNSDKTIEEITEQNTNINAGLPLKSALKKSVKIADEVSKPAASADTVNYYDQLHINQTYSRDSKLSYYVAIDLVMVPGTSISLAQKAKLKCQMKSDNIRKSLSQIFGTIYVPTPIFITTSEEYAKSKTEEERNRIIQYQTVTDLVNEKKMNNLKGVEFMNAMRETIPRSNRMKNAFTHLRIASGEYNSILKNHDITIEELNSLITDANYQRNFMGGRSKKARCATTRLRKTRKPSRRF